MAWSCLEAGPPVRHKIAARRRRRVHAAAGGGGLKYGWPRAVSGFTRLGDDSWVAVVSDGGMVPHNTAVLLLCRLVRQVIDSS